MAAEERIGFIEMRVADVRTAPRRGETVQRCVVLLEEVEGPERLVIWIGPFEATAIAFLLENAELPRPMTIQFVANVLHAAGGRLQEVRINRLEEGTFYAEVAIESGGAGTAMVDARPSDAMALALVAGAPIRVAQEVLDVVKAGGKGSWRTFEDEQDAYSERSASIVSTARSEWEIAITQLRDLP